MYDDLGSITTIPDYFIRTMELHGIQAVRFNPVHRFISRLYTGLDELFGEDDRHENKEAR